MSPEEWSEKFPGRFFLCPGEMDRLETFLRDREFLAAGETVVGSERAGDGNMNCTVRVRTNERSFIVKQSRPWVEKYPQFEAPEDRVCREIEFYDLVAQQPAVAQFMPTMLMRDPEARLLVLEDVGEGADYTSLYRGATFSSGDIRALASYLTRLHRGFQGQAISGLRNRAMRQLNADHIFQIPLQADNGLDLDQISTGLQSAANRLKDDDAFCEALAALACVYLEDGPILLHGDFFPGSILKTEEGPKVIDPEFAHFGWPEFDSAVFLAHLILAHQKPAIIKQFLEGYGRPEGFEDRRFLQVTGVEIVRRLIGYAQLPLGWTTATRVDLLTLARELVLEASEDTIFSYAESLLPTDRL